MATTHHVCLIPGFFGFVNFGRLVYFTHVREFLEDALSREDRVRSGGPDADDPPRLLDPRVLRVRELRAARLLYPRPRVPRGRALARGPDCRDPPGSGQADLVAAGPRRRAARGAARHGAGGR